LIRCNNDKCLNCDFDDNDNVSFGKCVLELAIFAVIEGIEDKLTCESFISRSIAEMDE